MRTALYLDHTGSFSFKKKRRYSEIQRAALRVIKPANGYDPSGSFSRGRSVSSSWTQKSCITRMYLIEEFPDNSFRRFFV